MAPKPDRLALILGMVLAMAVVATWATPLNPESNSVAPATQWGPIDCALD
jgi:hypothetical protein